MVGCAAIIEAASDFLTKFRRLSGVSGESGVMG